MTAISFWRLILTLIPGLQAVDQGLCELVTFIMDKRQF